MIDFKVNAGKILALTEQELAYLQALLDKHDRGAFYLLYNSMTGSKEAYLQTQISQFSGSAGGAAFVANRLLQGFFAEEELVHINTMISTPVPRVERLQ